MLFKAQRNIHHSPFSETQNSKLKTQNSSPHNPIPSANIVGYWIPRRNLFFGKAVRGGGWYPDHQLRLLRRDSAHYDETRVVHELAMLAGEAGLLHGHLLHLNIENRHELWSKQRGYAIQEAQTIMLAGQSARWRNLLGAPAREFYRRFVQLDGWRDGWLGLLLCATLAFFELVKYVHVLALQRMLRRRSVPLSQ